MPLRKADIRTQLRAVVLETDTRKGPLCSACALTPDVKLAIQQERDEHGTSWDVLTMSLRKLGHKVGRGSLAKHNRESHEQR